ncbi:MAG TPA: WXG100 family type VII secretion target [Pseudonocardiaceae bacterium]|jgi:uncharacterized protein YukE|nr:WXG100 family type VII secretion target [Pseudonocardiaceae bacterium]
MADEGYQDYSQRTSAGGGLAQAAQDTPLVGTAISAYQDATKGDIGSLGADIGNFVMGAQGVIEDPLNALISAGLSFLMDVIQPLRDCLEQVTGDAGALDEAKEAFADISGEINTLAGDLDQITRTGFQNWSGTAKDAASQQVATFVQGVQGTSSNADDVSQVLGLSAMLMEGAYNIVLGIISDCIEWLVVTWLAALAAEVPTLGASTAAAGAATTAEVGVEGANAADKVDQATTMVDRIVQVFQKIAGKLKSLGGDADHAESALSDADSVAGDADRVAGDADSVAGDAGHAGADAPSTGGTEPSDSSGSGSGPGSDEDGGSGGSGDGDKSWLQGKWDETRKNWNETTHPDPGWHQSPGQYLTSHETNEDGSQKLNRVQDLLLDPAKEDTLKLAGQIFDPHQGSSNEQSDEQIDDELQG